MSGVFFTDDQWGQIVLAVQNASFPRLVLTTAEHYGKPQAEELQAQSGTDAGAASGKGLEAFPSEQPPTCATCRFSVKSPSAKDLVLCRRFPPPAVPYPQSREYGWPELFVTQWCGEHQPRAGA